MKREGDSWGRGETPCGREENGKRTGKHSLYRMKICSPFYSVLILVPGCSHRGVQFMFENERSECHSNHPDRYLTRYQKYCEYSCWICFPGSHLCFHLGLQLYFQLCFKFTFIHRGPAPQPIDLSCACESMAVLIALSVVRVSPSPFLVNYRQHRQSSEVFRRWIPPSLPGLSYRTATAVCGQDQHNISKMI